MAVAIRHGCEKNARVFFEAGAKTDCPDVAREIKDSAVSEKWCKLLKITTP